ncbi:energy-coupling factor transporter transmembrane protein EcfT [Halobellus sp. H-GB7]|uniref:energy-coupling factor transporter transmembrane component T family protein n=1 Tax=Halobellus sp. H-GB7 TaxID=3069756 RepID=UPI0027B17F8E|nr:energy-coupling factor transporter transmembrane protein EcfT [Halobellus sp. H-GB7]MDQ2055490.1 energy-coupling factor transporter transmembrane protein EcfT [Halobellus sp. H-GB7]
MLTYHPGDSLAHRLDPRTKLLAQAAFAAAAFAHTAPRGLAVLTVLTAAFLAAGRLSPARAIRGYLPALPFLAAGPLIAAVNIDVSALSAGIEANAAVDPLLASYRVLLILFVSAVYLHTTPVRDSRAAIQRLVPGRVGRLLGVGVALVFRFFPLLRADLRRVREASTTRLGDERPLRDRMRLVGAAGIRRAFARADRLALALRARCFAWNPTLPELRFGRADALGFVVVAALVGAALL